MIGLTQELKGLGNSCSMVIIEMSLNDRRKCLTPLRGVQHFQTQRLKVKYGAKWNGPRSVWKCDQTRSRVFDISSQWKLNLLTKKQMEKYNHKNLIYPFPGSRSLSWNGLIPAVILIGSKKIDRLFAI